MAASSTSVYGFKFRKSLNGLEHPATIQVIIADSATLTLGDIVRVSTSGYVKRAAAGEPVAGVLDGIVDQNGINVFSPRAQGVTGTTLTPDDTVAVSSTNTSDGTRKLKAIIIPDVGGHNLYFNDADGDLAQTNLFQFFDVGSNSGQISQSSASDANGQAQLIQIDPDGDGDLSKGLYRFNETQYSGGIDTATAKNTA